MTVQGHSRLLTSAPIRSPYNGFLFLIDSDISSLSHRFLDRTRELKNHHILVGALHQSFPLRISSSNLIALKVQNVVLIAENRMILALIIMSQNTTTDDNML